MPRGAARIRVVAIDGHRPTRRHPGRIEVAWPGLAKTYHGEQDRYDGNRTGQWWGPVTSATAPAWAACTCSTGRST